MAERRMFAKTIIDSDAFLDMPLSSQALYFHLSMRADDDGFLNNAKKIQRTIGSADDDLKILFAKNFIIPFESGVCVIKHWMIHNMIQKDRYKPTMYGEEKEKLSIKNNKSYTMLTECIHDVNTLEAQVRLGKASLGEVSEVKDSVKKESTKGSRLSQDWVIPEEYIKFCQTERPDLDVKLVTENFKDFWISKTGSNATKLDWFATWRSWVRKERATSNVKKPMKGYGFVSDAQFNDWLESAPTLERIANE
jgi:hypothetical protein